MFSEEIKEKVHEQWALPMPLDDVIEFIKTKRPEYLGLFDREEKYIQHEIITDKINGKTVRELKEYLKELPEDYIIEQVKFPLHFDKNGEMVYKDTGRFILVERHMETDEEFLDKVCRNMNQCGFTAIFETNFHDTIKTY